ncbi:hypothetical protein A3F08_03060 [Candidatus Berkelbacteria bacterium RIFCSPHIGHO2_12_FULL_36_9]|uniref:Transglycosylase SLT domain-containing protein n=1 Tax=Candidatus Berkelbacteria bacterium RIFCSPHIGHO2_12_FULL_36_9 TaxID=1797469 RepID=A0A1F5EGT3_9BACT|nr:MAG: hypothetical protein A3F08_03060 [Candidatus Berkelbacteria bacterium RIFCSPHIGHO2_12_FULL_36_9]
MRNPESLSPNTPDQNKDNPQFSRRGLLRSLGATVILSLVGRGDANRFLFDQPPSNYPQSSEKSPEKTEEEFDLQTIEEIKKQAQIIFENNNYQDLVGAIDKVESYRPIVEKYAKEYQVDPEYLMGIIFIESKGDPNPKNRKIDHHGAVGLCQFLPETARNLGLKDRTNPEQSIKAAAKYIHDFEDDLGGKALAIENFHMGYGNLYDLIKVRYKISGYPDYPKDMLPKGVDYPQIYHDVMRDKNSEAYQILSKGLSDDSANYYFKVLAAMEILKINKTHPVAIKMGSEKFYKETHNEENKS